MMIDNNTIQELLQISDSNKKRLILNDKYICEFINGWFSEFVEDDNCSRRTSSASVIVFDDSKFRKMNNGKICICYDPDLSGNGMHSMTLYFEDKGVKTSVSISDCELKDARVQVKDFMKLIDFKPQYDVDEPYDNLGLTICSFDTHNELEPHIEFGIDGKLYYEVLDMNGYEEGSVISLSSSRRKDVIEYVKLTPENINNIADKINASLRNVYKTKEKDND